MTAGIRHSGTGPGDATDPAGLAITPLLQQTERAKPGDTILRPTRPPDDLTADLLRFGAGLVTLILAIVLGLGT